VATRTRAGTPAPVPTWWDAPLKPLSHLRRLFA
jgi:hypothetical protein